VRGAAAVLQWEYRMIDLNDLPRKVDELDLLNDAGDYGWELVAITVNRIAFLRRQIDDARSTRLAPPLVRRDRRQHYAKDPER
jgi:hypothetical protein